MSVPTVRPTAALLATVVLLVLGLIPTTGGGRVRSILRTLHTLRPFYSERNPQPTGYYVGLIDGGSQARDELTLRLVGKPAETVNFAEIGAARYLDDDFLQFELKPDVDTAAYGSHFTTNGHGLRDRQYTRRKPRGCFRIVLLGSSMDMGWGVSTRETYENRLEDWLNAHAAKRGLARRFEVLNFAMAAYSPLHRLEAFRRKAIEFEPDLVLYSTTRLDTRLLEIHLEKLLNDEVAIPDAFVRSTLESVGIDPDPPGYDAKGRPRTRDKELLKQRLEPILWALNDATLGELAELCHGIDVPLALLIVPRAGGSDNLERRGPDVARITATAEGLGLPVLDLSAAFDEQDTLSVEIAPWDDHPNSNGHRLLFLEIGRRLLEKPELYHTLFDVDPDPEWFQPEHRDMAHP
jgi:hypothetical protein